jgi:hypothetical protein
VEIAKRLVMVLASRSVRED